MAESRPRDLTAAELELLKEPMRRGSESVPLAVPPGTQVPVHLLDPTAAPAQLLITFLYLSEFTKSGGRRGGTAAPNKRRQLFGGRGDADGSTV